MIKHFEGLVLAEEGEKDCMLKTTANETVIGTIEVDGEVRVVLHVANAQEKDSANGAFITVNLDGEDAQAIDQAELYRQMIRAMIGRRSQQKWADKLGFHVDTVKRWLGGSRVPPAGVVKSLLMAHGIMARVKIK